MNTAEAKRVLEAVLLCAGRPMSLNELRNVFSEEIDLDLESVRILVEALRDDWAGRGVELTSVASGWQFRSRADIAPFLDATRAERAPRYSRAVLETLAIIAYRQPVTRGEIEEIRGVTVASTLIKTLEDRGWIEAVGHKNVLGRPVLWATTQRFLDDLGLRSVQELPALDSVEAAGGSESVLPDAPPPGSGPMDGASDELSTTRAPLALAFQDPT